MNMDITHDVRRPINRQHRHVHGAARDLSFMIICGEALADFRVALGLLHLRRGYPARVDQILRDALSLRRIAMGNTGGEQSCGHARKCGADRWRRVGSSGLVGSIALIGFHLTFFLFPMVYTKVCRPGFKRGLVISVCAVILMYFIFDYMQGVIWPSRSCCPSFTNKGKNKRGREGPRKRHSAINSEI
jgi:hypothetical protein